MYYCETIQIITEYLYSRYKGAVKRYLPNYFAALGTYLLTIFYYEFLRELLPVATSKVDIFLGIMNLCSSMVSLYLVVKQTRYVRSAYWEQIWSYLDLGYTVCAFFIGLLILIEFALPFNFY